jgi:hypothetical protein
MAISAIFENVIDEAISVKPPVAVLKEVANELAKITKGLLDGKVQQEIYSGGEFMIDFYINAPSLNNYSYLLFQAQHNLDFYPLMVIPTEGRSSEAKDQDEFEAILKTIISSPQAKKVINGLLAQIKS